LPKKNPSPLSFQIRGLGGGVIHHEELEEKEDFEISRIEASLICRVLKWADSIFSKRRESC